MGVFFLWGLEALCAAVEITASQPGLWIYFGVDDAVEDTSIMSLHTHRAAFALGDRVELQ